MFITDTCILDDGDPTVEATGVIDIRAGIDKECSMLNDANVERMFYFELTLDV